MMNVVIEDESTGNPLWLDVTNPTGEDLSSLAEHYGLHRKLVEDCMEPAHLPKHEKLGDTTFMIIRAYDEHATPDADTVQAMTRKIAMFLGNRFLITIHREDPAFLAPIRARYRQPSGPVYLQMVLLEVLTAAVETFHTPLEAIEITLHGFEQGLLQSQSAWSGWKEVFRTKSQLMLIKRILWHSLNTVQKFIPFSSANVPLCQDLRERIENLHFFATGLLDDLNSLLNIQMALVSNRTADIMRVLAVFSVFFLPITFIVGVYGMNFQRMPELTWRYGYAGVWVLIILVDAALYLWIRKRGWV